MVGCPAALRITAIPRPLPFCGTSRSLPALIRPLVSRAIGTPLLCHAISIAYELAAGRAPLTWGLSHLELCGDHDLGPCGGELSDNLGVRCRIGDH